MKVLVYCANGLPGQPIVNELLQSGHQIRALVRDGNRAAPLAAAGAEIAAADLSSDDLSDWVRAWGRVRGPHVAIGRRWVAARQ